MKRLLAILLIVLAAGAAAHAVNPVYQPTWESLDARPIPQWYDDAKFGIFIHWGVYSVPAWAPKTAYAEWYWHDLIESGLPGNLSKYAGASMTPTQAFHNRVYGKNFKYEQFAPLFRAELFDPDQWADFFQKSGARYVVLTSKHHDGFCLWPAPDSAGWNSVDTGPGRDLVGDLAKAVRARGVRFGLYYSLYEWYNPLYKKDVAAYVDSHMLPQLKDVVSRYAPAVIFTDGEWDHPSATWRSPEFLAWLYNQGPNPDEVVVDDRWGKETRSAHGGYYTSEYGNTSAAAPRDPNRKWEENRGMGRSFGYNRNEDVTNYKSAADLIHMLIDIVSQGGNLLLDVGPTADGRIPVIMQERLLQIGDWLGVNGEAIYGTHPWRAPAEGDAVRFTATDGAVYAIVKQSPSRELTLKEPVTGKETRVELLGHDGALQWTPAPGGGMTITMPDPPADALPCRCAYAFKLTGVK